MIGRAGVLGALVALGLHPGCAGSLERGGAGAPFNSLPSRSEAVGAGRYATALPAGEKPPSNHRGDPVRPKVTADFSGVPTSNDWWSSLIWQYDPDGKPNPHSENLYPHPLTARAESDGLAVGYPTEPAVTERGYLFSHRADLLLGVEGLAAPDTRVADYSDWVVTASWANGNGGQRMSATFGHGLPFVYVSVANGRALVDAGTSAQIWSDGEGVLGLTVNGHHWGIFGPRGTAWTRAGGRLLSDLGGKGFFSVAVLPDRSPATLEFYRRHAYAFVTESRVTWRYDDAAARLVSSFALTTVLKETGKGNLDVPLTALYRHQWMNTDAAPTGHNYLSPRGLMKVIDRASFDTVLPFYGVLPVLPTLAGADSENRKKTLKSLIEVAYRTDELFPAGLENTKGTYWKGKSLQKVAVLAWLASDIGYVDARDRFVRELQRELEDWFDGRPPGLFYYDRTWATLFGVPQEYKSGWQLNDHHFHAGYFIFAAATVARFDPAWAGRDRFGGMVDLLIKDAANWERGDRRFPFLRNFDAYAGHSWANGPALFAEGNNQESSSEDVNFSAAAILWGAITGHRPLRDMGIFLYVNQVAAIQQYWFDVDRQVFPRGFDKPALGIVWGAGGKYDTWWDRNPVYVHGINMLPVTAGSLYLGQHPAYVRRNTDHLIKVNRGEVRLWRDVIWMFLALDNPARAIELYDRDHYFDPEFGNSMAAVYQWIHALAALGVVDTTVTADVPTHAVFRKGEVRTHVAFNPSPSGSSVKVRFSDGVTLDVPPGAHRHVSTPIQAPASVKP